MNFLRRLFGGPGELSDPALHLYVRCSKCSSAIHTRIHRMNDLTVEYGDDDTIVGYRLRKEMMDGRCFRLVYTDLHFDRNRREVSRAIEGGEFISADEYQRLTKGVEQR